MSLHRNLFYMELLNFITYGVKKKWSNPELCLPKDRFGFQRLGPLLEGKSDFSRITLREGAPTAHSLLYASFFQNVFLRPALKCCAGGRPSTWSPPGRLAGWRSVSPLFLINYQNFGQIFQRKLIAKNVIISLILKFLSSEKA